MLYVIKRNRLRRLIICTSAYLHICTFASMLAHYLFTCNFGYSALHVIGELGRIDNFDVLVKAQYKAADAKIAAYFGVEAVAAVLGG